MNALTSAVVTEQVPINTIFPHTCRAGARALPQASMGDSMHSDPVPVLLAIMIQLFNKLQQYCNTIALLWSAVRKQKPIPAMLAVSAQMSDQCPPAEQINAQTHTEMLFIGTGPHTSSSTS